jgi:hypothetical protein
MIILILPLQAKQIPSQDCKSLSFWIMDTIFSQIFTNLIVEVLNLFNLGTLCSYVDVCLEKYFHKHILRFSFIF